jgi:Mg2+/Co2+ transporter CorB
VDNPAIVVAAYASVGIIVASALVTAAIIISADIRSRTAAANIVPAPAAQAVEDAKSFEETWQTALNLLKEALARLNRGTEIQSTYG